MSDEFLDPLVGSWALTGTMGETELRQKVDAQWVVQGRFLRVHFMQEVQVPEDQPLYEAVYMLGYDDGSDQYVMHSFDTFGAGYSRTVGVGSRHGDSVEFLFEYQSALFSNTFSWNQENMEWTMLIQQQRKNGE